MEDEQKDLEVLRRNVEQGLPIVGTDNFFQRFFWFPRSSVGTLNIHTILTVDERDFRVIKPKKGPFILLLANA